MSFPKNEKKRKKKKTKQKKWQTLKAYESGSGKMGMDMTETCPVSNLLGFHGGGTT